MDEIDPKIQAEVAREVWRLYRPERRWPESMDLLRLLTARKLTMKDLPRMTGVQVYPIYGHEQKERVVLEWRAFADLPEGQHLFAPLPRLIKHAGARLRSFCSFTDATDYEHLQIPFAKMVELWSGNRQRALDAVTLLKAGMGGVTFTLQPDEDCTIFPQLQALRFLKAETFTEVVKIGNTYTPRGRAPAKEHLRLMRILFDHAREHLAWPVAVPFAAKYHWVGFLPTLAEDLHPKYLVESFGYHSTNRLALKLWSLSKLDADPWRKKVVQLVRAIAVLWERKRQERAALPEAAAEAKLAMRDAAVAALLLESEPWARGFETREVDLADWKVGGHESVWAFRECSSWPEYIKLRVAEAPEHYDQFGDPGPVEPFRSPLFSYDEAGAEGREGTELDLPAEPQHQKRSPRKRKAQERAPTKKPLRPRYDYDVALSFAGEDRPFVEKVAEILVAYGLKVFYDAYEEHSLWGKDLYVHLDEVYRSKSKYCVVFVSRYYAKKLWTSHERRSAQARAFRERQEYILPVRFDATKIPGLLETVGYLDARRAGVVGIANAVAKKLGKYDELQSLIEYLRADLGSDWTVTQEGRNLKLACASEDYVNVFSIGMLLEAMRADQLWYFLESSILPR